MSDAQPEGGTTAPREHLGGVFGVGVGLLVLLGLVFGVLLALVRDFVDPSVKGPAQAFRLSRTPILAEVPKV